jgi:hypothetical protein
MSVDTVNASGVFRVGDVMSRAWRLFTGNLLFFILAPFVLYLIMVIAIVIFVFTFGFAVMASGSAALVWVAAFLGIILVLSFTMIGQGMLLLAAFQRLRGQPLRVGEVLQRVLSRLGPLLGLAILWGLAILVTAIISFLIFGMLAAAMGMLVLVLLPAIYIPATILLVMWAVVVPACIVENLGPIGSMIRSTSLTKGYRWKIFGIMFLLLFLLPLVASIVQLLLAFSSEILSNIFAIAWFVGWIAYFNCAIIMTYHDLRVAKEGVDTEQIASIFD